MPKVDAALDRRIAALAIPAPGAIAAEPACNLADTAIVGHLGRIPLDSLAIVATALMLAAWVAIFPSTAGPASDRCRSAASRSRCGCGTCCPSCSTRSRYRLRCM